MSRYDLACRSTGVLILLSACATGFAHARAADSIWSGDGAAAHIALAVAGFTFACLGLLLILKGSRLREGWQAACDEQARRRGMEAGEQPAEAAQPDPLLFLDPGFGGGRLAMTTWLILRAQQQGSHSRPEGRRQRRAAATEEPPLQRETC